MCFLCKVSCLEIYQEVITDLLCPERTRLQLREDLRHGIYVDNLSEEVVNCGETAIRYHLKRNCLQSWFRADAWITMETDVHPITRNKLVFYSSLRTSHLKMLICTALWVCDSVVSVEASWGELGWRRRGCGAAAETRDIQPAHWRNQDKRTLLSLTLRLHLHSGITNNGGWSHIHPDIPPAPRRLSRY